jgi:hypothetical protein
VGRAFLPAAGFRAGLGAVSHHGGAASVRCGAERWDGGWVYNLRFVGPNVEIRVGGPSYEKLVRAGERSVEGGGPALVFEVKAEAKCSAWV